VCHCRPKGYNSVWHSAVRWILGIFMSAPTKNDARLNFRLRADLKTVIEEAAAALGQSVSDFAVSTLVQTARSVLQGESTSELTNRDRDFFIALLDDTHAKPNKSLREAAKRYKKHFGK
jgi:uncharacterized protein (DUF1778 family)